MMMAEFVRCSSCRRTDTFRKNATSPRPAQPFFPSIEWAAHTVEINGSKGVYQQGPDDSASKAARLWTDRHKRELGGHCPFQWNHGLVGPDSFLFERARASGIFKTRAPGQRRRRFSSDERNQIKTLGLCVYTILVCCVFSERLSQTSAILWTKLQLHTIYKSAEDNGSPSTRRGRRL